MLLGQSAFARHHGMPGDFVRLHFGRCKWGFCPPLTAMIRRALTDVLATRKPDPQKAFQKRTMLRAFKWLISNSKAGL
jgi:hypothetical protein